MSLLGRLEDLSLPDIVQIVYLSRRTGMLEIVDGDLRWGIFFLNGLVANAFSPEDQSLLEFLDHRKVIPADGVEALREAGERGEVVGDVVVSRGMLSNDDLAELIRLRITTIVRPLLTRRSGEFNFILSDSIAPSDLGYDVETLFRQGGVLPSEILDEGEKAKPLQNLEETMRAGKALLRGESGSEVAAFGFGEEIEQMAGGTRSSEPDDDHEYADLPDDHDEDEEDESQSPFGEAESDSAFSELDLEAEPDDLFDLDAAGPDESPNDDIDRATDDAPPFSIPPGETLGGGLLEEEPIETASDWSEEPHPERIDESPARTERPAAVSGIPSSEGGTKTDVDSRVGSLAAPPQARSSSRFRIEGQSGLTIDDRNVILYERNPMLRVAAKRAFGQSGFNIFQFGQLDEVRRVTDEMLDGNRFFVAFLEIVPGREADTEMLIHQIKRTNRHLPLVVIDQEASLERRHGMLKLGADMYLTKPGQAHLQPAIADQSLRLFADELVQFAEHAVQNWERLTETYGEGEGAVGAKLYEIAEKERLNRTRTLMRSLINELADPDDIGQLAQTILRLANEYLDRAALFAASPTRFIGLGGFGPTGTDKHMDDLARKIRIARDDDSVLRDVMMNRKAHRGKLKKTSANVKLLQGLGTTQPTQVIVIPIENDGAPVGVLYGDNAGSRSPMGRTSGLEIFLEQAGLALHNAIVTNARRKGLDWETK